MTKVNLAKMGQAKLVEIRKAGKALLSGEKKWREVIDSVASAITMHGYQVIDKVALDLISAWQTIDAVKGKKRNTKGVKSAREAIYIHFCPEYATIGKGQTSESMTFRKDIDALIQIVINKVSALECEVFNTTDKKKKPPVATPRAIVNKVIGKTVTTRKPRTPDTKVVRFNQKASVQEIRISQKITDYKHDEELCRFLSELLKYKEAERKNQA